jgi:hypothetical protein
MGVISDLFTDPPELVAGMRLKPSEPRRLAIEQAEKFGPEDFIEQLETDRADRRGMVPPRRHPRRVAKKLAARGYSAHFGGPAFTAAQVRSRKYSAPALARWLGRPGLPTSALTVVLAAVQFGPAGLTSVEPYLASGPSIHTIRSFPLRTPLPTVSVIGPELAQTLVQHTTLVAKDYGVGCALYKRQVRCLIRVFREDKDDAPAEAAIQPIVERIAARLVFAIARAAHGWTDTKILSRHTSYRPITRS